MTKAKIPPVCNANDEFECDNKNRKHGNSKECLHLSDANVKFDDDKMNCYM